MADAVTPSLRLADILSEHELALVAVRYFTHDPMTAAEMEAVEAAMTKASDAGYHSNGPKDRAS